MASRMVDRVSDLGDRARERMMESRLDKVDRENDRLKSEVRLLREDLHEERSSLQQALDALKQDGKSKKPRRSGRLLRTIVIGGGAYVLGTRAGREQYDRITEKARSLRSKAQERMSQDSQSDSWEPMQSGSSSSTGTTSGLGTTSGSGTSGSGTSSGSSGSGTSSSGTGTTKGTSSTASSSGSSS
jgi:hypothetical protein